MTSKEEKVSLELPIASLKLGDLLNINRADSDIYKLSLTVLFMREIEEVTYLFGLYGNYVTILGYNPANDTYLSIDEYHLERLFISLVTKDTLKLKDALDKKEEVEINIASPSIYYFDLLQVLGTIASLTIDANKATQIEYSDYIQNIHDLVVSSLSMEDIPNTTATLFITKARKHIIYGSQYTTSIKDIIDDPLKLAILLFLQIAFTNKALEYARLSAILAKSISEGEENDNTNV
jgi:hypothetical protein